MPGAVATGKILEPAFIYTICNKQTPLAGYWAITASTDIAFFPRHCIIAWKTRSRFTKDILTALAINDDLGAIVIITQFYGEPVQVFCLPGAVVVIAVLYRLNPQQASQRQSLLRY